MSHPPIQPAAGVDFRALNERIAGTVTVYGAEGWTEAREAWSLDVDQRPVALVDAESADDVVAVAGFARTHGYRIAQRGTGHAAPPLGALDDTILLEVSRAAGEAATGAGAA